MLNERMRIGLVTGEFPPMEGGVGAFTQELGKALAAHGHEVHIITHRAARPEPIISRRYSLGQLRGPVALDYATLHPHARRWGWRDVRQIADIVVRYDLEIINIQYQAAAYNMRSLALNLAPWRLKGLATTIVTFHDLRVPFLFPKAGVLRQLAVQWMARSAHGVIATNSEDYEALQGLMRNERLRQIPIGSNMAVHQVGEEDVLFARRQLGVRPADCLLGYFGFLNESKGADTLIRALAELGKGTHLVFIGGNVGSSDAANNKRFLQQLRQLSESLGISERVHWTGFVPDEMVSRYFYAADLIVMPYRDGVSLRRGTLMAALAHNRPVISTRPRKPIPELRHGENIWLVPADDLAALAEAVVQLQQQPDLRARLGRGAGEIALNFTWDRIAASTVDFYATVTQDRHVYVG